jgi:DNA-binding transcriptional regulator LsrR (DeoR family)
MAGQHIEREARYATTGATDSQRDELIWKLHQQGWKQRQIANHVGLTQPGVKHAIDRLMGKKRIQTKYNVCDGCYLTFPADQLTEGLCTECED